MSTHALFYSQNSSKQAPNELLVSLTEYWIASQPDSTARIAAVVFGHRKYSQTTLTECLASQIIKQALYLMKR